MATVTTTRAERATSNLRAKLDVAVNAGDFYEALQLYKTLSARMITQRHFEEAREVLFSGSCTLAVTNNATGAAELAVLLVKLFTDTKVPASDPFSIDCIITIYNSLNKQEFDAKQVILKAAIKWSTVAEIPGDPRFHTLLAKDYYEQDSFSNAQYHFVLGEDSNSQTDFASMLHRWASHAPEYECSMFLTRAVLQLLVIAHCKAAIGLWHSWYAQLSPSSFFRDGRYHPLVNFSGMIAQCIAYRTSSSQSSVHFNTLRRAYEPYLAADKEYSKLLDQIGRMYFSLPSQTSPPVSDFGNMLGGIMQNILGGAGEQ